MGWTPPDGIDVPRWWCFEDHQREASVEEVSTIDLDLAKHVFQAHGASGRGCEAVEGVRRSKCPARTHR
jgi:hypothetical protein